MAIFCKNGSWYIDFYCKGRRVRECVGESKTLAKKALAARKGEIAQERFGLLQRKERVAFKRFLEDYLPYCKGYKSSFQRVEICCKHLESFFRNTSLDAISPEFIEKYKLERVKLVKPATVNRELSCLRHIFNMAIKWGRAERNPVSEVSFFHEERAPIKVLSEAELGRLIGECSEWLKPIVVTALNTGMRMREILDLEWRNVDLDLRLITVERTKSKKNRTVPINTRLYALL